MFHRALQFLELVSRSPRRRASVKLDSTAENAVTKAWCAAAKEQDFANRNGNGTQEAQEDTRGTRNRAAKSILCFLCSVLCLLCSVSASVGQNRSVQEGTEIALPPRK